jgi:hypothetical protein
MAEDRQTVETDSAEVARLRAERDELQRQLQAAVHRGRKRSWWRQVVAVALVIATCLTFTGATVGVWARRNFLDTERFVSRVGPLVEDPAVQDALATWMTDQVMTTIDSRQLFESVLPERGRILVAPLQNAVRGFVHERVDDVVATDEFRRLWVAAATVAHRQAVEVLRRQSQVVTTSNREVTINLIPVIDAVLARITSASPEVFGRVVNLPDVKVEDLPDSARQRLGQALGVDLGPGFGQFTVYDDGQLSALQDAVALADRFVPLLLPLSVVLAAAALWVSQRRRRTLLQLSAGLVLAMVLLRRVAFRIPEDLAALPPSPQGQHVAGLAATSFVEPLTVFAAWVLAGTLLVAAIALVTGPYRWARAVRRNAVAIGARVFAVTGAAAGDDATVAWVARHRDLLLGAGVVVTVLFLALVDLSWWGLVLTLGVLAAYGIVVWRTAARPAAVDEAASTTTTAPPPPSPPPGAPSPAPATTSPEAQSVPTISL